MFYIDPERETMFGLKSQHATYTNQQSDNPGIMFPNVRRWTGWLIDILAVLCITLIIMPESLSSVTAQIGIDPHPVSFWLGPALYQFGERLIPGIDYMTQYGIGYGSIVKYLIDGVGPDEAVIRVTALLLAVVWGFYVSFYFVANCFLRSRSLAFSTTVFALLLNFYTSRPFWAPSVWPTRYPLLMLFCYFCVVNLRAPTITRSIIVGASVGLSCYLNTEPGILMGLAVSLAMFLTIRPIRVALRSVLFIWIFAVLSFYTLAIAYYGYNVLSIAFLRGLVEPFFLYGGGFGAWLVNWSFTPDLLFNVIGPIVLIATIGWALCNLQTNDYSGSQRDPLYYLLILSVVGTLMLLKWVNMSLSAVWFSSAHASILVAVFWLGVLVDAAVSRFQLKARMVRFSSWFVIVCVAGIFLAAYTDPRMDTVYGLRSWRVYPSLVKSVATGIRWSEGDLGIFNLCDCDIALIKENSLPTERVAIVSNLDFAYLIAAQRPPKFEFLPSTMTPLTWQLDRSLVGARIIFVDRSPQRWPPDSQFTRRIEQRLNQEYEFIKSGEHLFMYSIKAGLDN